jgi:hypothetical protein
MEEKEEREKELLKNKDKALTDELYFIKNLCYIEDKTNPAGVCLFNMWPEQERALKLIHDNQFIIAGKARQIGITWLVLVDTLFNMLTIKGYTAIAISKRDTPDAVELSTRIQLVLRYLPIWLIRPKKKVDPDWRGLVWYANDHEVIIERPDGEASRFLTLPASADTAHSFTANRIILDEWALHPFAEQIWTGAFPTMNRAGFSGQVIGLSTGRRNTLFERIWIGASKGLNRFVKIFLSVWADPRRTSEWYEQTKRDLPNTWRSQYPETEEDMFSVGEGAFFEEWDESIHVPIQHWAPTKEDRGSIIGAYDPGFATHACFKWYFVFHDGRARCFREYYPHRVIDTIQAETIRKMSCYDDGKKTKIKLENGVELELPGTPYNFEYIVADTDAWSPSRGTGKTTAQEFAEYELYMRQADKNLSNGWRQLHKWMTPFECLDGIKVAFLTFTRDCANTIRTYPACEQSETVPEDISAKCEHHPQDVDRYFVMSRPMPNIIKETELDKLAQKYDKTSAEYQIFREMVDEPDEDKLTEGDLGL